ncbi:MAG: hypothetical protein ABIK44_07100, partial [candidate division WOR-3 bacterium]
LTARKDRLDATGSIKYRIGGLELEASGNTYRDFETDSLPAQIRIKTGQRFGLARAELTIGRSFKQALERYRTGRLSLSFALGQKSHLDLVIADEYPEQRPGRGRMLGFIMAFRKRPFEAGLALAIFDISGTGIRLSTYEPGAMRIGSSFITSETARRIAAGVGLKIFQYGRLGLKLGCTWKEKPRLDMAGQLELGLGDD